jgi:hydrogenase maturation protease
MLRTLIIGYGNLDRADDGVAHHVIESLRARLGQEELDEDCTGLEDLGGSNDSIWLTQLVPELVDTLRDYDHVIFVDAHVQEGVPGLYCAAVAPEYSIAAFTHHMTPGMLIVLCQMLYQQAPMGHIVSARGHDFDFRRGLSPATEALVEPAVEEILRCIATGH